MAPSPPPPSSHARRWLARGLRRSAATLRDASATNPDGVTRRKARGSLVVVAILFLGAVMLVVGAIASSRPPTLDTETVAAPADTSSTTTQPTTTRPTTSTTTTPTTLVVTTTTTAAPPISAAVESGAGSGVLVVDVIDGDTIDVEGGVRVRLIGIDTPERGECGFESATSMLASMVANRRVALIPGARDDADRYGRLLRYVEVDGTDANLALLQAGLAIARYDGLDGYGRHPRQDLYRSVDAATPSASGCPERVRNASPAPVAPLPLYGGGGDGSSVYFRNCDAARAAGAAPLYAGSPGYRAGLDGDSDGVACEGRR